MTNDIGEKRSAVNEWKKALNAKSGLEEIGFTVFGEPQAKQRPRTVRDKRSGDVHTYTPKETLKQEEKIAWVYKSIYGSYKFDVGVPLRVSVKLFLKIPQSAGKATREKMLAGEIRPTKKVLDVDNAAKLVMDAGNGVIYEDDAQIAELVVSKYYSDEPRTEIFIARLADEE